MTKHDRGEASIHSESIAASSGASPTFRLGWAQADITPEEPVLITGQFHSRLSEGIEDQLTVTALVLDSNQGHVVMVSCDIVTIPDELRDAVRSRLREQAADIDPLCVIFNATHTHAGPEIRVPSASAGHTSVGGIGVELEAMPIEAYLTFLVDRIIGAIATAWNSRSEGGVAYGLGHAVIGYNRRWVNNEGNATMYGLNRTVSDGFRHIEGYEDHSLNLLATYDLLGNLTGLVVNLSCPSQESEGQFILSADWWHETRQELRMRFGAGLFVLAQCSAAGDQSPHLLLNKAAEARMLTLKGRTSRQEIAQKVVAAVGEVLPYMSKSIETAPILRHHVETLELPANKLTEADVHHSVQEAERWRLEYEKEKQKLDAQPELRNRPRWYVSATNAYRRMHWNLNVSRRFEYQKTKATLPAEIHVLRLGDMVIATNPYELYLDFGIQIKVRSEAVQTFLVQLAGAGTYLPSPRSLKGGAYGSTPASNPVGPEGGQVLVEHTVRTIQTLWAENKNNS